MDQVFSPPLAPLFIGGEGDAPPSRVSHPQGVRPALDGQGGGGQEGEEREAPGLGVLLPCASPLYIGVEGAGFLPSKSIGALAKVGERNPIISLPHRLLSPFFRDLDLIPSGYDLIPSKVGSWCALTSGVGPCPHYPRSCGSPHAGGPHFGTF